MTAIKSLPLSTTLWPALLFLLACSGVSTGTEEQIAQWKNEIKNTEQAFASMAAKEGVSLAFLTFAADDAVLSRGNKLILGKEAIRQNFEKQTGSITSLDLVWSPDFVDVSNAGDLGYTYGKYSLSAIDSLGTVTTSEGIFHTVWKRQEDGSWKFVWD